MLMPLVATFAQFENVLFDDPGLTPLRVGGHMEKAREVFP